MKKNNILHAALAFCLLPALAGLAGAAAIDSLRSKIALEAQIEERLNSMLSSYLNTKDVAVAAKVNVLVKKAEGDNKDGGVRRWDDKDELILPGVPAATSMTKDSAAAAAAEAAKKQVRLGISSIDIFVVVGKQVSKDQEAKIKKLISGALDLDIAAGDTITIESAPPEKAAHAVDLWIVTALFCLLVLAVFLYGPFRGFLKKLNDNIAALATVKKGPAEHGGGPGDINLAASGEEGGSEATLAGALSISGGGGGGGASVITFDSGENTTLDKYVTKDNVEDLALILQNEPPEVIARVVQRIPQKLAYMAIPQNKMREVLEQYLRRDFDTPEKIKTLLDGIKDKMAGSFGGETRLANLLQIMDKKSQERTLVFLREKDAAFTARLETRFFKFDDLLRYDETAVRRIFRKAGTEPFACCLKNCDDPTREVFLEMLGPAIKNLVTTRMDNILLAVDSNESELAIFKAVNDLAAKGLVLPLAEVKKAEF